MLLLQGAVKMCEKRFHNRLDRCLKPLIKWLNDDGWVTVTSCCGHGKYPITVVVRYRTSGKKDKFVELFSGTTLARTIKFYKKDNKSYYHIPEVKKK